MPVHTQTHHQHGGVENTTEFPESQEVTTESNHQSHALHQDPLFKITLSGPTLPTFSKKGDLEKIFKVFI